MFGLHSITYAIVQKGLEPPSRWCHKCHQFLGTEERKVACMPYPWVKLTPQQIPLQTISGSSLKILVYIGSFIDADGIVTLPVACIKSFFGLSRRQVLRCLKELFGLRLLEKLSLEGEVLRIRILKGIRVGKLAPGEDRLSVRDAIEWGAVDRFHTKNR